MGLNAPPFVRCNTKWRPRGARDDRPRISDPRAARRRVSLGVGARGGARSGKSSRSRSGPTTIEQCRKQILEAVKRVDDGTGVVILTDMFGGTPSNLAISVMSQPKVEVLAGINLPMLIKLAKVRETATLQDAVASAQEAGRKYCTIASRVLNGK